MWSPQKWRDKPLSALAQPFTQHVLWPVESPRLKEVNYYKIFKEQKLIKDNLVENVTFFWDVFNVGNSGKW